MHVRWARVFRPASGEAVPLDAASLRLLVAAVVGVLIWMIWVTGMLGDSRQVTMLALSAVSILGLGLVVELRRRYVAEEVARDSERRYRLLAENSFDMIVRFDPRTQRRTYVSPASQRLYGYTPEEACALSAEEIIHPDDLPAVRAALAEMEREPQHQPVLYRGRRKDGAYVWVEASLTRSCNPVTGVDEVVAVVRDVTERVRYEDALRQAKEESDAANLAKSRFLATMSHELRTPLNAIIGFTDVMQHEVMGPIGNEQYRSYITDIQLSGTHLLQLINDILDLTKAEAGKLELHEDQMDVREAVRSVVRLTGAAAEKAGVVIDVELAATLPTLRADERKVRQILFNLVGNAIKFTPAGGRIAVLGRFEQDIGLTLTVADNGIGIPSEELAHVLEPFIQLDSAQSRQHQGTGLGLPTAKALVELHGGTLMLRSAAGAGTEVTVLFPAERAIPAQPGPAEATIDYEPQRAVAGR